MAASQAPLRNLRARLLVVGFLVKKNRICMRRFSSRGRLGVGQSATGQLRKLASVLMQDEGNRERVSSVGRRTKLPVGPYPSRGGAGQHGGA
jgi:hypothetical protein